MTKKQINFQKCRYFKLYLSLSGYYAVRQEVMKMFKFSFERSEIKYLLSDIQYGALMKMLRDIVREDSYGKTNIMNIYFDTPDFGMIRTSLEKPVYKEKLRLRTYGTPSDDSNAFAEIKKKYDGIVYKRRILLPYTQALDYLTGSAAIEKESQISKEIDYLRFSWKNPQPTAVISYDRVAFEGIEDPDLRITFDENIRYRTEKLDLKEGPYGRPILPEGMHLMELKIAGAIPLNIARILSELKIFPVSFSKYGRAYEDFTVEKIKSGREIIKYIPPVYNREGDVSYA